MHQEIIAILIFVVVIGAIITEKVHRTSSDSRILPISAR